MHVKKGMVRLQGKKENEYKFESKRRTKSNTKKERKGEKILTYSCWFPYN